MPDSSFKRIFIVGCPRSGTTLLQSMVSAHPEFTSYPETHFWDYTIPEKFYHRIPKIYSGDEQKVVRKYLEEHGFPLESMAGMNPFYFRTRKWSRALMQVLDNLTGNKLTGWIEKTPRHLLSIPYIKEADRNVFFIHVLREGKDVVASMYEVTHKYPEYWNGPRSIDTCIERWKNDIEHSRNFLNQPKHSFVLYDDLIHRKENIMKELCGFLGIEFASGMVDNFKEEARDLVDQTEEWKSANIEGRSKKDKFDRIFSAQEQDYILEQLDDVSLDDFRAKEKGYKRDKQGGR